VRLPALPSRRRPNCSRRPGTTIWARVPYRRAVSATSEWHLQGSTLQEMPRYPGSLSMPGPAEKRLSPRPALWLCPKFRAPRLAGKILAPRCFREDKPGSPQ
jgi:hypothetical protein